MPKANPQSRLAGLTEEELLKYRGLMGYAAVHSAMDASIVTEFAESLAAARASEARKKKLLEKIKKKCVAARRGLVEPVANYDKAFKNIMEIEKALAAELEGGE